MIKNRDVLKKRGLEYDEELRLTPQITNRMVEVVQEELLPSDLETELLFSSDEEDNDTEESDDSDSDDSEGEGMKEEKMGRVNCAFDLMESLKQARNIAKK